MHERFDFHIVIQMFHQSAYDTGRVSNGCVSCVNVGYDMNTVHGVSADQHGNGTIIHDQELCTNV